MSAATGKSVEPMLATLGRPLTGERWAFESKWMERREFGDSQALAVGNSRFVPAC